jgi:hypothetical protein
LTIDSTSRSVSTRAKNAPNRLGAFDVIYDLQRVIRPSKGTDQGG